MALSLTLSNIGTGSGPGPLQSTSNYTYIPGPQGEDFILVAATAAAPTLWQVRYNQDGSPWWQFIGPTPMPMAGGQVAAVAGGHFWWMVEASATNLPQVLNGMSLDSGFNIRKLMVGGINCAAGNSVTSVAVAVVNDVGQEFLLGIPTQVNPSPPADRETFLVRIDASVGSVNGGAFRGQAFVGAEAHGWSAGFLPGGDSSTALRHTVSMVQSGKWLYCWGGYVSPWSGSTWGLATMSDTRVWKAYVGDLAPGKKLVWVECGLIPQAIHRGRPAVWRRWLLSVGGFPTTAVDNQNLTDVWAARLDQDVQSFVKVFDMPIVKNRGALWTHGDRIYHLGGYSGSVQQQDCWWGRLEEIRI